jgi:flavin reductase (DIM6/NTAB) family NADH-FMN oxidoreductase RutF
MDAVECFEQLVSDLDSPMIIVTAATDTDRAGCLVGFSTKCSIDPARYAVFISKPNHTATVAAAAETLVVHLLRPGDGGLARLFGETSGDEIAKFDLCEWSAGPNNTPVIAGCDWFAGRVIDRVDVGDHVMHLLDVTDAESRTGRTDQLGSQAVRDFEAGHQS